MDTDFDDCPSRTILVASEYTGVVGFGIFMLGTAVFISVTTYLLYTRGNKLAIFIAVCYVLAYCFTGISQLHSYSISVSIFHSLTFYYSYTL